MALCTIWKEVFWLTNVFGDNETHLLRQCLFTAASLTSAASTSVLTLSYPLPLFYPLCTHGTVMLILTHFPRNLICDKICFESDQFYAFTIENLPSLLFSVTAMTHHIFMKKFPKDA